MGYAWVLDIPNLGVFFIDKTLKFGEMSLIRNYLQLTLNLQAFIIWIISCEFFSLS